MLTDKIAFVSGAAAGIGRATAVALAQAGAHVAVNDLRDDDRLASLVAEIQSLGRRALPVVGDVSNQAVVEGLIERTATELGGLDCVVTNAVYSDREPFYKADMAGFHRTIDVTMWGAFYVLRAAAQRMIAQGRGGAVTVISSPHATIPVPNAMAYNMAKAAIDHMARTAAIELIDFKIRVNVIHPGWVDTPGERKFASAADIAHAGDLLPWGRMAKPEEIARGVVFLSDPGSDYMTGGTMLMDGGNSLPWWARSGMAVKT
ncbi:MAG: SDR family oxidoreductase [Pirellulales bacterium]